MVALMRLVSHRGSNLNVIHRCRCIQLTARLVAAKPAVVADERVQHLCWTSRDRLGRKWFRDGKHS